MGTRKPLPHRDVFEKHGETGTRFNFAGKEGDVGRAADAWLAEQQAIREEAAAAIRDAREEETLSISRKALSTSNRANTISICAIICSAIAAITAALISIKLWS